MLIEQRSWANALFKGLNGGDDWEAAKIDELILGLEDLFQKIVPWFKEQDEAKKVGYCRHLSWMTLQIILCYRVY